MKSNYAENKAEKIERYKELAKKHTDNSNGLFVRAHKMAECIPFGQPIIVGHHSEGRDRRFRARIHKTMDKAVEEKQTADYYNRKAASAASNKAISSDDPDAVARLKVKIAGLEKLQEIMKAANKIVKRAKGTKEEKVAELEALRIPNPVRLFEPDFCGRIGFPDYALSNNNANIRTARQRLEQLQKQESQQTTEQNLGNGIRIVENMEDNRLQIFFPGKPAEDVRAKLKSHGFHWSPTVGAWQRQRSSSATWAAQHIIDQLGAEIN
jgi:hypothetical protein